MKAYGVIFDFNGTLFFDTHLHNRAWDLFLERHSISLTDAEKNVKIHGKNNAQILPAIFQRELSAGEIDRMSIKKEDIYQALCLKEDMHLAPGAEELLDFLVRNGVRFTIATASDLYNVEFYFAHLRLDRFFKLSEVVYSDGMFHSKPDPGMFLKAMQILDVQPEHTLIFEDSPSGIKAAENARAGKIIVVNSTGQLLNDHPYEVVTSFAEVDRSIFP